MPQQQSKSSRTGEMNGSLSGSARFTLLFTRMNNDQFLQGIGHNGEMVFGSMGAYCGQLRQMSI
jgi:hypothetical protein